MKRTGVPLHDLNPATERQLRYFREILALNHPEEEREERIAIAKRQVVATIDGSAKRERPEQRRGPGGCSGSASNHRTG